MQGGYKTIQSLAVCREYAARKPVNLSEFKNE